MRREDRSQALEDVQSRVLESLRGPVDETVAESLYHERRRLKDDPHAPHAAADREFWESIETRFRGSSSRAQEGLLQEIVRHYASEIAGNFDDRVYQVATRAIPPALGLLLNAASPKRLLSLESFPPIDEAVVVQGEVEQLRRLRELGTVLFVPTHVSNLDSIIVGFALYRIGLPPFIYGAGLNLFQNPIMGFFMRNLGAYTVDRKKQDGLYKQVLKTYATTTLEMGYHGIFFPGGTRSRAGSVETKLKLGLLGTSINAYTNNLQRGAARPNIYIVPATLSFELVLEAETLIDDFLKDVGKSRYIITDDEFSHPRKVFDFINHLLSLDSKIYFTIGRGMDPFGNPVDDEGRSLDPLGRVIDPSRYVLSDGEPKAEPIRDGEYLQDLAAGVSKAFLADNVIQSTHVTARTVFGLLREKSQTKDLIRLIRTHARHEQLAMGEVYRAAERLLGQLRDKATKYQIRLDPIVSSGSVEDVIADGLRHFAIYHAQPAAARQGDQLIPTDRALLFYYQNRLEGYGVLPEPAIPPALSADHRRLEGE